MEKLCEMTSIPNRENGRNSTWQHKLQYYFPFRVKFMMVVVLLTCNKFQDSFRHSFWAMGKS